MMQIATENRCSRRTLSWSSAIIQRKQFCMKRPISSLLKGRESSNCCCSALIEEGFSEKLNHSRNKFLLRPNTYFFFFNGVVNFEALGCWFEGSSVIVSAPVGLVFPIIEELLYFQSASIVSMSSCGGLSVLNNGIYPFVLLIIHCLWISLKSIWGFCQFPLLGAVLLNYYYLGITALTFFRFFPFWSVSKSSPYALLALMESLSFSYLQSSSRSISKSVSAVLLLNEKIVLM